MAKPPVPSVETEQQPLHSITVNPNLDINIVTLVLDETRKVYGNDFDFQSCTITNHYDGTYSVEFVINNRVMVKDSGGLFASRP